MGEITKSPFWYVWKARIVSRSGIETGHVTIDPDSDFELMGISIVASPSILRRTLHVNVNLLGDIRSLNVNNSGLFPVVPSVLLPAGSRVPIGGFTLPIPWYRFWERWITPKTTVLLRGAKVFRSI